MRRKDLIAEAALGGVILVTIILLGAKAAIVPGVFAVLYVFYRELRR